ncbi:dipeptide ABC transporter membrane subunit DppC [Rhodovastum atsumiense]|uniref:ABC transporter permease n=1 Tax=Rhodovastum atsumiense TaxID=504468 RepID=A0A5M6IQJ6_9PROT|nr:ABC transporter permease [Rhodovastum atsumiense]KAA5610553.1 ABC transporter permease [Rhodovastum atsumiense]CAH2604992.1 dipeptide ABC transporter membrane subunit DppC [Rhodovastum atsumiense]
MSATASTVRRPRALARLWDSDVVWSFRHSPIAVISALVVAVLVIAAVFSRWLAPHDPFDLASLSLMDSLRPPAFLGGEGDWSFPLGTDDQGRDVLSTIMYGMRVSLVVGVLAVGFALVVGIVIGLVAGYVGGLVDTVLMRIADIQLTFPAILIALLVDGIVRAVLPRDLHDQLQIYVLVFAIGIARWPQFARTVRGSTLIERGREYVMAARVIGLSPLRIMATHILPNVLGPVLVIATLNVGLAIVDEATLSFLGVGLPPTQPSLGTLIRIGNDFLFSGEWWITIFPGLTLAMLVLSINLLGDWLRDALNPRLR